MLWHDGLLTISHREALQEENTERGWTGMKEKLYLANTESPEAG